MQDIEEAMQEWGVRRRELFEQYCKEKDKDASIIFNEEEWNKFAEWEKDNDVIAREVRIYKCNKIEYSFNADDDGEVKRQFREWTSEQNDQFDMFIADEVQKHCGLSWQDDGFDEAYDETVQEWYDYYSMGVNRLADFINSFGGDYTATIKEWTEWDCKYWDVDPEELKKDFEEVGMWRGGYI